MATLYLYGFSRPAQAQLVRSFSPRFTVNDTGDIFIIGNTLMSCRQSTNADPPETCHPNVPKQGTGSSRLDDQEYDMRDVNVAGGDDNSSSAQLTLPPGASVLWAGLYWGARGSGSERTRVRFATPTSGGYQSKMGTIDSSVTSVDSYQGFVDVTTDVQAGGSGTYRVADVVARTGENSSPGFFAGWALVVVMKDSRAPLRNMTVFDGYASVDDDHPVTTTISGFTTPLSGVFRIGLGAVTYEGDLGLDGTQFELNGVQLGDAANPTNDFFNSSIARFGVPITDKNPNFINQMGFDIDVIDASGILPNGASSATLKFTSSQDIYYPGVLTFANEVFQPVLKNFAKIVTDINGGALAPGDILEYALALTNTGNDSAVDLVLTDAIPFHTSYVPGSLRIIRGANVGAQTDDPGDDEAEFSGASVVFRLGAGASASTGGRLAFGEATTVAFRVRIAPDATLDTLISNQGSIAYSGETLGTTFTELSDSVLPVPGAQPSEVVVGPAQAELALTKNGAPNPIVAGENLTMTLIVGNVGPSNAAEVLLRDMTPPDTTFVSASAPNGWSITAPDVGDTGTVTFTHASLPPGTATLTLVVRVDTGAPNGIVISNTATITSPTDRTAPHQAATTVQVIGAQDLYILKSAPPLTGQAQDLSYALTVTNPGPDNAGDVIVRDTMPPRTTFQSASAPTGWSVSSPPVGGTGTVRFSHPSLPPGDHPLVLVVQVDTGVAVGTTLTNTATVESPSDSNAANNTATAITTLSGPGITKQFSPNPVLPGATSTLTLTLTNPNAVELTDAAFTDTMPNGVTTVSGTEDTTCPDGSVTRQSSSVRLTGGTIPANGSCTVTVGVKTTQEGSRENTIAAGGLTTDGGENTAPATATLYTLSPPTVTKKFAPSAIATGSTAVLTITLTNPNNSTALLGAAFTDTYPARMVNAETPNATTTCTGGIVAALPGALDGQPLRRHDSAKGLLSCPGHRDGSRRQLHQHHSRR